MNSHIKAGRVHLVLSFLYLVVFLLFLATHIQGNLLGGGIAVSIFGFLTALHSATGFGAMKRKDWARRCSTVLALLLMLCVPIGTAIGIYLLYNGTWSEPRKTFDSSLTDGWPSQSNTTSGN
ncbi:MULTISPECIES: hypothetical protein [Lysobacter]|jgi:putative effector of murein hydrolase LrgA (UPF0299 family)|uniref:hypothetical protein n=1 Tax=Lysobacter TaxID=68 RepID=UPI001F3F21FA|nr:MULTISPECIES: hypothetical protein [Lysobacter]UJB19189.1 hypothetical protein L1A79_23235 [Lysobacter capsici]UJQ27086.1 hypothetical protein L2D09_16650 [Lysobacter gummosus]